MAPTDSRKALVVAALTFNRQEGLRLLLEAWRRLPTPPGTVFLVVDNSHPGSAREQVTRFAAESGLNLYYEHEPSPGLSAARNRALEAAIALGGGRLAFIDDDELPSEGWIAGLLETQARTGAEAVIGRVLAVLPPSSPAWIARAGFFDIAAADGADVLDGGTCNALIDLAFVARHGLRFDPAFGLSGAEDTVFFRSMRELGAKIVFSEAALVHDIIPEQRARLGWLMQRWRRTGNTDARIRMMGGESRSHIAASGAARVALGWAIAAASSPAALVGRFDLAAQGVRIAQRGLGYVAAASRRTVLEYGQGESAAAGAAAA